MKNEDPRRLFPPDRKADMSEIENHAAGEAATVAIIEDEERQREALNFQLATAGYRVSAYPSAESFLCAPNLKEFDCVIADICLPKMNGLRLFAEFKSSVPSVSFILVTGHGDMSIGVQAMREGAADCLEKPIDDQTLLKVVRGGTDRSRTLRLERFRLLELLDRERSLTPREHEVFTLVTSGMLNKLVGAKLGPTEYTIKKHRARVMMKMRAESFADLVRMSDVLGIQSNANSISPRPVGPG